ncbi:MAG: hypothetical protein EWV55_22060 [Microcystis viridis Mv_BB_P_19951000_S69]|jgi:hypothetical protein|uniref:DUF6891 domain-containing protein n=1 Tax=Microcystis viridis Mv_BB_P_19951000_S68D TaxID=2486270 RepID=A0A552H7D4_MICVR|nr:hypothetical protein [Microcystis aeruginosa]NCR09178.1 hypothetical protein [Microcystis aeruginosa LG13-11]TRU67140.1 MAG: hypothetical protein EWV77_23165 [Microcystis viridis Mv_BB_P_19951000_S68D]TRU69079.1 MAG: hypothetical protein EWV55_22060 [Microcystis viridis Mv_BB_P_19951000_S69]TRU77494.1 MAG: hypothetical protein EWV47_04005 [Microcystis viridis Mv_BB_P_19951000_S68]TRU89856.1 MAG: hypothetical protein EWV46_02835 [Microcystis viridis Mv_BB_P_19951000_S69D]
MNDTDKYILDVIKTCVWSGFYDSDDVHQVIDDILEDGADEAMLRSAVSREFEKKAIAEDTWPDETDCDRLDQAFQTMNSSGIIALQNAGYTMSDGLDDVGEVLHERGRDNVKGYCFYHGQDLERAVAGTGLMLAFGDLDTDPAQKTSIGNTIKDILESKGFVVEWNGDPESRLNIPELDWKRRRSV